MPFRIVDDESAFWSEIGQRVAALGASATTADRARIRIEVAREFFRSSS